MELAITVSLLLTAGVLIAFAFMRERARRGEETLRSISDLVAGDRMAEKTGAALVQSVRTLVEHDGVLGDRSEKLEAALAGVLVGVVVFRPDGALEFANDAAQDLIDGTGDWAVLGTRASMLAKTVARVGVADQMEVDMHDPDRRVIVLRAVPLGSDATNEDGGGVRAVAVYLDDRTDQRRLTAMRKDFVANASHELKTPLGALSLLAETLGYADDEEKRALLAARLQSEAARMANVVDDILTLAKTESLASERVVVDVSDLVADVVDSVGSLARTQQISLVDKGVDDVRVVGDPKQLASALRNLFDNAITYTAVKGEPGMVTYRSRFEDGNVCIEVADTGIGIPTRYTDRVFERFFRVDQARSRESGGTGLGLSIVRNVARAHGGSVSASSQVGIGTTMSMCLPLAVDDVNVAGVQ